MKGVKPLAYGSVSWRKAVLCFAVLLIMAAFLCPSASAARKKAPVSTEAEVAAVLMKMADLYKQKDVQGIMALYSKDKGPVAVGVLGDENLTGADKIRASFERAFAGFTEIRTVTITPFATSFSGKIAWFAAVMEVTAVRDGKAATLSEKLTGVMVKSGKKWLLVQTHLSLPADVRGKSDLAASAPPALDRVQKKLTTILNVMDAELGQTASQLSKTGISGPEAHKVLADLCKRTTYAVDCAAIDVKGKMTAVEPQRYRKFEGADISAQEQVKHVQASGKPVFSTVFPSVEGFDAVDLEYPVFSQKNELLGSASILMKPEVLFSKTIPEEIKKASTLEIWVMQTDGRILYDVDKKEIGRMLFKDDLIKPYPELLSLANRMVKEKSGRGFYRFPPPGSNKAVVKEAFWTTVSLHGTEWKIVASRVADSPGQAR